MTKCLEEQCMKFNFNDGGREESGYKGMVGDCVARSICIATGLNYKKVYDDLSLGKKKVYDKLIKKAKTEVLKGLYKRKCKSARQGVPREAYQPYLESIGWKWIPKMKIGSGCQFHLRNGEIPMEEIVIVRLSRHMVTVVNGVINDTYDCSRKGDRCVYGYFIKEK